MNGAFKNKCKSLQFESIQNLDSKLDISKINFVFHLISIITFQKVSIRPSFRWQCLTQGCIHRGNWYNHGGTKIFRYLKWTLFQPGLMKSWNYTFLKLTKKQNETRKIFSFETVEKKIIKIKLGWVYLINCFFEGF